MTSFNSFENYLAVTTHIKHNLESWRSSAVLNIQKKETHTLLFQLSTRRGIIASFTFTRGAIPMYFISTSTLVIIHYHHIEQHKSSPHHTILHHFMFLFFLMILCIFCNNWKLCSLVGGFDGSHILIGHSFNCCFFLPLAWWWDFFMMIRYVVSFLLSCSWVVWMLYKSQICFFSYYYYHRIVVFNKTKHEFLFLLLNWTEKKISFTFI